MQIKRIVAEVKVEWLSDDGKNAGSLAFGAEAGPCTSLSAVPDAVASALRIPVASMVPPLPPVVEVKPKAEEPRVEIRPAFVPRAKRRGE